MKSAHKLRNRCIEILGSYETHKEDFKGFFEDVEEHFKILQEALKDRDDQMEILRKELEELKKLNKTAFKELALQMEEKVSLRSSLNQANETIGIFEEIEQSRWGIQ